MPTAHEIDYQIHGHEMQYVEVELDPGESAVSEAGSLMYKDPSIEMTTVFGDGVPQTGDFMDLLVGAGKRLLTGLFGGEGVFFARLRGPGHVWLQSLPFSRLAGRIMANLGLRGRRTDEGSVLGSIGDILRGN